MVSSDITGAVLVQAADALAETDWLLTVARREPTVIGVVGYFPLADPAEVAVEHVPQTRFVLDHCGKPPFGGRDCLVHLGR